MPIFNSLKYRDLSVQEPPVLLVEPIHVVDDSLDVEVDDGAAAGGGQEEGGLFLVVEVEVESDGGGHLRVLEQVLRNLNGRIVAGVAVVCVSSFEVVLGGSQKGFSQGVVVLVAWEGADPPVAFVFTVFLGCVKGV